MIANNDGWIDWVWTEDKPYPETLETKVIVMFRDGTCAIQHTDTVEWWYDEEDYENNWYNSGGDCDIIAYRVVN
jgi:hypothetical protein